MKTMRQISVFFLAIVMALSLAACEGAEKTLVLSKDMSAEVGIPATDTWTLTAKGDTVKTMKEVAEFDLSEFDAGTQEEFASMLDSLLMEPAKGIDGLTCTGRMSGNTYIIEITINCSGNTVKEAVAADIIAVEGDNDGKISLKLTQSSMEQQGYKVVG